MKKKIIIVDLRTWGWTGIGRVTSGIYNCTKELSSYYSFKYIINKNLPIEIDKSNIINFKSKPFGIFEQIDYFFLFLKYRKSSIILHSLYFNVPIIKFNNVKLVVNFYDVLSGLNEFKTIFHKFAYYVYCKSILYNKATVLCQSDFTLKQIRSFHNFDHKVVCSPGYKDYLIKKKINIRKIYGIEKPFFLYIGLNKPRKNLQGLLDGYGQSLKKNKDIIYDLVIAGPIFNDNRYGFDVKRYVNSSELLNKRVHLLGFVEEDHLYSLYKNASLYVVPSFIESGFSYPALEALSSGTPVLLNKYDMYNFSTNNNEVYFFYSNLGKGSNFNKVIYELLSNKNIKKIDPKKSNLLLRFSWEKTLEILKYYYSK